MKSKDEKIREKMDKFGINFDEYDLEELRRRNSEAATTVAASLAGSRLYSLGSALKGNTDMMFLIEMNRAQVEQNFIMMRQNEEIVRWLKALYAQNMR